MIWKSINWIKSVKDRKEVISKFEEIFSNNGKGITKDSIDFHGWKEFVLVLVGIFKLLFGIEFLAFVLNVLPAFG